MKQDSKGVLVHVPSRCNPLRWVENQWQWWWTGEGMDRIGDGGGGEWTDRTMGNGLRGGENLALRLQTINNEPQLRAQPGTHIQLVRNRGLLGPRPTQTKGEQTNPSQVLPSRPE